MAQSNLEVVISGRDRVSATLAKVASSLGKLDSNSKKVGKGFGQLGAGLVRASVVGIGAIGTGLGFVAREAIKFEDAFAGVRKTVDESALAAAGLTFDDLARSFRDMATEIPIAATEFARIGETAGALGIKAGDIDDFTRTVALLGVTTDLTADAAADSLGRIGTILGFTGRDFENFADVLVNLGNQGASTESEIIEIVKRFAQEGKAAGLATEEIAALASATASLGFAPERGGTALGRVFANMATNIALANAKGKTFASVTGRSIKDLQSSLNRGEGLGIFLDFLKGLKGLNATDAAKVLKAAGITNTSDRTLFRAMADQLPFINDQLKVASTSTGALGEEARKRFDTIASKLQLLRNNAIEAAITIGEGMLPAIGRAADKLSGFLRSDENREQLKALGEDIGAFIDSIDWAKVVTDARSLVAVLKTGAEWALKMLGVLNKLPTEVKGAAVGLIGLNSLSGGLVGQGLGNIIGGLGGAAVRGAASRLPGVGAAFAQPVFVTNWPIGFGPGGIGGPAGGVGRVGAAGGLLGVAGVAALPIAAGVLIGDQINQATENDPALTSHRAAVAAARERRGGYVVGARGGPGTLGGAAAPQGPSVSQLVSATVMPLAAALKGDTRSEGAATRAAIAGLGAAIRAMPAPQVKVNVSTSNVYRQTTIWRNAGNGSRINVGDRVQGGGISGVR